MKLNAQITDAAIVACCLGRGRGEWVEPEGNWNKKDHKVLIQSPESIAQYSIKKCSIQSKKQLSPCL